MSAEYKLTYFNFRGRAEIHRLLFDIAGQKFEDKRLTFDEWRERKADYPFQQVPVLDVTESDGRSYRIAQSHSITRFLAKRFNLAGRDDVEAAQCDMINEAVVDMVGVYYMIYRNSNKDEMLQKLAEASKGEIVDRLKRIQNILEANKDENGFLVGNALTYADVQLVNFYDLLRDKKEEVLAQLPLLKAHYEKIRSIPSIEDHVKRNAHVHLSILFAN